MQPFVGSFISYIEIRVHTISVIWYSSLQGWKLILLKSLIVSESCWMSLHMGVLELGMFNECFKSFNNAYRYIKPWLRLYQCEQINFEELKFQRVKWLLIIFLIIFLLFNWRYLISPLGSILFHQRCSQCRLIWKIFYCRCFIMDLWWFHGFYGV